MANAFFNMICKYQAETQSANNETIFLFRL